jgi:hypothetical protein
LAFFAMLGGGLAANNSATRARTLLQCMSRVMAHQAALDGLSGIGPPALSAWGAAETLASSAYSKPVKVACPHVTWPSYPFGRLSVPRHLIIVGLILKTMALAYHRFSFMMNKAVVIWRRQFGFKRLSCVWPLLDGGAAFHGGVLELEPDWQHSAAATRHRRKGS